MIPPVTLPVPGNAPSNLAALLLQVTQAFSAVGDATPIEVGKHYLSAFGAGSSPRVLFVPETGAGKVSGDLIEMGNSASMIHSCDVYVRGGETQDDISRFALAYALADKVIDFVETGAMGRIQWGSLSDDSPVTAPSGMGAGLKFSFTYQRAILHDPTRWALPAPSTDTAAPVQPVPSANVGIGAQPAIAGTVSEVIPTTVPED